RLALRVPAHTAPPTPKMTTASAATVTAAGQYQIQPRPGGRASKPVRVVPADDVPRTQPANPGRSQVAGPDDGMSASGWTGLCKGSRFPLSSITGPRQARTSKRASDGEPTACRRPGSSASDTYFAQSTSWRSTTQRTPSLVRLSLAWAG